MQKSAAATQTGTDVRVRHLGPSSFSTIHQQMLELQRELGSPAVAATAQCRDTLILFEPSPVITLGSSASSCDVLAENSFLQEQGIEIVKVDRGGEATYHGPGQLLAYPVFTLGAQQRDLHSLLRCLENAVIETLDHWGIEGQRDPDHTGVWVAKHKIASIGLSVRRWVTGHGLSLSISGDLSPFQWIIPCGIQDCPVTSMEKELGSPPDSRQVETILTQQILNQFGRTIPR